jgi:hypothetical protein
VYESPRLCCTTRAELFRPFSLVGVFELCQAGEAIGKTAGKQLVTFGSKIRLRHCGTGKWLTVRKFALRCNPRTLSMHTGHRIKNPLAARPGGW